MNGRALGWALVWAGAALAVAAAPGHVGAPRLGMAAFLGMLALTVALVGNAEWVLRRTTKPTDYEGGCPVGKRCAACGHFNLKPRGQCRACDAPVSM